MINFLHICERIKECRKAKNLTQIELAEMVDKSFQFISQIERQIKFPSLETVILIANALEISVDQLLNGNQEYNELEYFKEVNDLLSECDSYERQVIYDVANATKLSLMKNRWLKNKKNLY